MATCDVLVIGAGPAGASAALAAAEQGVNVILAEKDANIGMRIRCAELVPRLFLNEFRHGRDCIVQPVDTMTTVLPSGERIETKAPGYIIDRRAFDRSLVERAVRAGTRLHLGARAVDARDGEVILRKNKGLRKMTPSVIIGTDGPKSIVARWIGAKQPHYVLAIQCRMPVKTPMNSAHVYFRPEFVGGYGWMFPRGALANVGVGVLFKEEEHGAKGGYDLRNTGLILEAFIARLRREGKVDGRTRDWRAGLIPAGGPNRTVADNILLAGDAAGQTHSITGAGIPQAVLCGKIAGETAARAVKERDPFILYEYENIWRGRWGRELDRAARKRKELEAQWDDLDQSLRNCWVTFPGYYSVCPG